jgi:hypothetical protein
VCVLFVPVAGLQRLELLYERSSYFTDKLGLTLVVTDMVADGHQRLQQRYELHPGQHVLPGEKTVNEIPCGLVENSSFITVT